MASTAAISAMDQDLLYDNDKLTSMTKSQLIEKVKSCPELWNHWDTGYRNNTKKNRDWERIGIELGIPSCVARKQWEQLRGQYSRAKKSKDRSEELGSTNPVVTWMFYNQMNFLARVIKQRIPQPAIDSSDASSLQVLCESPPFPPQPIEEELDEGVAGSGIMKEIKLEPAELLGGHSKHDGEHNTTSMDQNQLQHSGGSSSSAFTTEIHPSGSSTTSMPPPPSTSYQQIQPTDVPTVRYSYSPDTQQACKRYRPSGPADYDLLPLTASVNQAAAILPNDLRPIADEDQIFGDLVTVTLRKLPLRLKAETKMKIQQLLCQAEIQAIDSAGR